MFANLDRQILKVKIGAKSLLIFACICSGNAGASSWINDTKITDVRWYAGNTGYISTENTVNTECGNAAANGNRFLTGATAGHDKLMSLALAAMTTGKKVNVLLDGCYSNTHSIITGIVVKAQ